ncbi:hypothetical protein JCGZ_20157 [Jatropha curcas]|uniref:Aminotransferase-like plant mobile domain-containing protein n=1 Tax=Jatropha curcas TaxID=180498 RepID=A0A067JUE5_JATCU|nr:hypothetical protein JCGZ_20157 [Jatropha curcas]
MVELIGIDLPRIVGPGSASPALSVSRRWLSLQAPGIYASYRRGELTATQVARFTLLLLFASTFWSNRKEKFSPSILKSLENLAHLEEYDWAGAILSRMYDDMCDLSRGHCKLSGTYYYWETWAFEYFPYTRPKLIHADLGLVPLAWRWYRTNLQTALYRKSLRDLRTFFDTCTVGQVEAGAMNARLQGWIEADPHFRRSEALSWTSRVAQLLSFILELRTVTSRGCSMDEQSRGATLVFYFGIKNSRVMRVFYGRTVAWRNYCLCAGTVCRLHGHALEVSALLELRDATKSAVTQRVPRIHNFESGLITQHLLTNLVDHWRDRNTRYLGEGVMQDTVTPEYVNWFYAL